MTTEELRATIKVTVITWDIPVRVLEDIGTYLASCGVTLPRIRRACSTLGVSERTRQAIIDGWGILAIVD